MAATDSKPTAIDERIDQIVAGWPPLSEELKGKLAEVLS